MTYRRSTILLIIWVLVMFGVPAIAQNDSDLVELSVDAGYGAYFREDFWLPLRIEVRNDGDDINGRLIVRPESSGRVVSNAYSTPIDLPSGSGKAVFLYILARAFPPQITVELLDDEDLRVAETEAALNFLDPQDQLYVVVTGATGQTIGLNDVHVGGHRAVQTRWAVENIPDNPEALRAITMMLLMNVDSEQLTTEQMTALQEWVTGGGHLILAGGPNWQSTTAAFSESNLLPFLPQEDEIIASLGSIAEYAGDPITELDEPTVITTGEVVEGAEVLIEENDLPVLVRQRYGAGTVDYLTVDPTLEPLRSWGNTADFWFTTVSTISPYPGWIMGLHEFQPAATSVAILPGIDLLPPVSLLCAFLGIYILVIGPLNYLVLRWLNRLGWAWVTVPLFVLLFVGIAWLFGLNVRATSVTLSRLSVVESWADDDTARVQQFIGLLSTRRESYSLSLPEDRNLRTIPAGSQTIFVNNNPIQVGIEIEQDNVFSANDFAVDAGIFTNFSTAGIIPKEPIGGSATIQFDTDNNLMTVQGAIRNDSELTLFDPVILSQGVAYYLNQPLEPGDVVSFDANDITIANETAPSPSARLEYTYGPLRSALVQFFNRSEATQTVSDIMGESYLSSSQATIGEDEESQQIFRRQKFLESFMLDQYASTARADKVYLAGWTDEWARDVEIENVNWDSVDTTLYIAELDTEIDYPSSGTQVTIPSYLFTWTATERENFIPGINSGNAVDLTLFQDSLISLRFTPIDSMRLADVDELRLYFDRASGLARFTNVELYDWRDQDWVEVGTLVEDVIVFSDSGQLARFVGPNNAVEMRFIMESTSGTTTVRAIRVEQTGHF